MFFYVLNSCPCVLSSEYLHWAHFKHFTIPVLWKTEKYAVFYIKNNNNKKHIGPYDYYDIIHLVLIFIVYENFHYVLRSKLKFEKKK